MVGRLRKGGRCSDPSISWNGYQVSTCSRFLDSPVSIAPIHLLRSSTKILTLRYTDCKPYTSSIYQRLTQPQPNARHHPHPNVQSLNRRSILLLLLLSTLQNRISGPTSSFQNPHYPTQRYHPSCAPPTFSPSSPPSWPSVPTQTLSTSRAGPSPTKSVVASASTLSLMVLRAPATVTACRSVAPAEGPVALLTGLAARCLAFVF